MTAILLPVPRQSWRDANGLPLVAGTVETYVPGTSTLKDTWQDSAQTTLNTHPVVLDARGEATIWGNGAYRVVVKDALGNLIYDAAADVSTSFTGQLNAQNIVTSGDVSIGATFHVTGASSFTGQINSSNLVVSGDVSVSSTLDVEGNARVGGVLNLAYHPPPSTPTSPGNAGDVAYDGSYIYMCVQNNNWKRTLIVQW